MFGHGDLPAILSLTSENVDWKFFGARGLPYTEAFRSKDEVAKWFAGVFA